MIKTIHEHVLPAVYTLLPEALERPLATRLLLAIGWQESRFRARRQHRGGPARGFWQFEKGGGWQGILTHPQTTHLIHGLSQALTYASPTFEALEDNDLLAAGAARILLWSHPTPLPLTMQAGWEQYLAVWRPGRPHVESWPTAWDMASRLEPC